MSTNSILKILNPALAIVLIFQLATGLLHVIFTHEMFETIHGTSAGIFIILVALHLILNWNWIKVNFLKKG
ncbi:conserved hypothetical protein [uncultured Desulfobacterium sp.]|uniref:DUF4405 domain-containing protein n=1 Tax=uncultured Desulfobacterium sp. TaxID=201089 RepID=A0A445MU88_9BACT|nr:conserved hypothetical protein [uncultured Desulfobacterium sp.]